MRKILIAVAGVLCLASGSAMANHEDNQYGQYNGRSDDTTVQATRSVKLHRWGFNLGGKSVDPNRVCNGAPISEVKEYRTRNDIMYSIFSLGWYTPKTARVTCGG